jgi:hypothetical protein
MYCLFLSEATEKYKKVFKKELLKKKQTNLKAKQTQEEKPDGKK